MSKLSPFRQFRAMTATVARVRDFQFLDFLQSRLKTEWLGRACYCQRGGFDDQGNVVFTLTLADHAAGWGLLASCTLMRRSHVLLNLRPSDRRFEWAARGLRQRATRDLDRRIRTLSGEMQLSRAMRDLLRYRDL